MDNSNSQLFEKAGFWERLLAYVIDSVLVLVVIFFLRFLSINLNGGVTFLIIVLYNALFLWKQGATIGKKLLRLKVVDSNYKPLNFGKALIREVFKDIVSSLLFNLGYLWVLIDQKKQAWHDKVAKTFVVKLGKDGNLISIQSEELASTGRKVTFVLILVIPLLFFGMILFYLFVGSPIQIKGSSMDPNYTNGQYYITNKMAYRTGNPRYSDVIVFLSPKNADIKYDKRIIGLPGEKVEIRQGHVYINDMLLDESYLKPGTTTNTWQGGFIEEGVPVTIPKGEYFVLGDNRLRSSDSREFGFITNKDIISKIWFCYFRCNQSAN